ncbi:MAG TPA: calcium-binding protein [Burkholderiales bacterium]|nr:calcium-binding protein [Burkholderiales bacterium]
MGGLGNDLYIVDATTDVVTELANAGSDTIESSATYSIAARGAVEHLTLTGSAHVNATGNALANILTGNGGNNSLDGGAGNDTMVGGLGDDTYVLSVAGEAPTELAGEGNDTVRIAYNVSVATPLDLDAFASIENLVVTGTGAFHLDGTDEANRLTGNASANSLSGGLGNDTLDGGTLVDTMAGGEGDDLYVLSMLTDRVMEDDGQGNDTVRIGFNTAAALTVSLAAVNTYSANVENLEVMGTGLFNLTGDEGANVLRGNAQANVLDGGLGADTLEGGNGNDVYKVDDVGDRAVDTVAGALGGAADRVETTLDAFAFDEAHEAGLEQLRFMTANVGAAGTGNGLNNSITGNSGDDTLDGGAGNDTLVGGLGNDLYIVDATTDVVTELANAGSDTIESSATYSIAPTALAQVEHLTLTGTANINATGNTQANILTGNSGNNSLAGGTGNDTLLGGEGNDTLSGGAGIDTLQGGDGDDTYLMDATADTMVEAGDGGIDTVVVAMTYTLVEGNVENVTLSGTAAIHATGNSSANTLTGNTANNVLSGLGGDDTLVGGAGADTLQGGEGNDSLAGGAGIDSLVGGAGDDIYVYDGTDDLRIEAFDGGHDAIFSTTSFALTNAPNIEAVILGGSADINAVGNEADNLLLGNSGANSLEGGGGADTLDGAGGNDFLNGGFGDDLYYVDHAADQVFELGGNDTVVTSVTYTLGATAIESIQLAGSSDIGATGNELAQTITGNAGSNALSGLAGDDTLDGAAGADSMDGGAGNDTYHVDDSGDAITEASGTDTVRSSITFALAADLEHLVLTGTGNIDATGNASANALTGNAGNNVLDGGSGNDTMTGLGGDDTYHLNTNTDVVVEAAGGGVDTVIYAGTGGFIVAANVEIVQLAGSANSNALASGATQSLVMTGNEGNNSFSGGTGDDTISGGAGDDLISASLGNDRLLGEGGADIIDGSNGMDDLAGGEGNDTLEGGSGHDTLDGGAGNDSMRGGDGDDTYYVDSALDVLGGESGSASGGIDTVHASVDYSLASFSNYENLVLVGAALHGTGNSSGNTITGTSGDNSLVGGSGNDSLIGGDGADTLNGGFENDTLAGGAGDDVYLASSFATIFEDADSGTDTIRVSGSGVIIAANVENLEISGGGNVAATGNGLANSMLGGTGLDTLNGSDGDDTLSGGDNSDRLDGDAGADVMIGGAGHDAYVLDDLLDTIVETADGGTDVLLVSYSTDVPVLIDLFTFADGFLESAQALGTGEFSFAGNAAANNLVGNASANTLQGGDGSDSLQGWGGDDSLSGGIGNDSLYGGQQFSAVASGNDTLDGGAGADSMAGGSGDDVYLVDSASDIVSEGGTFDDGNDTVIASVSYTVPFTSIIELLLLAPGAGNIDGHGSASANAIVGNEGDNVLSGGVAILMPGNDTLTGGGGADTFYFAARDGVDVITDFSVADGDRIRIAASQFAFGAGALDPAEFLSGEGITEGSGASGAQMVYDTATGHLYYDADIASPGSVHFATLTGIPTLSAADFEVT